MPPRILLLLIKPNHGAYRCHDTERCVQEVLKLFGTTIGTLQYCQVLLENATNLREAEITKMRLCFCKRSLGQVCRLCSTTLVLLQAHRGGLFGAMQVAILQHQALNLHAELQSQRDLITMQAVSTAYCTPMVTECCL